MNSLYELTGQYEYLMNCLYDEDYDEKTLIDTLDGIEGEIEEKADAYARIMKQLARDAEAYKQEEKRMAAHRRALENRQKWLKEQLYCSMKATGKTKFKTPFFSFSIVKNPASLVIDDASKVPEEFLITLPPEIDGDAIKTLLKAGEVFGFAHLEQGEHVNIR